MVIIQRPDPTGLLAMADNPGYFGTVAKQHTE